ncbi:MAG: hypothetical protein C4518_20355 [Desulfobacteraceae bacterium]|nr:MAG: hypothetical protein C4518_20355 [Desulfobacteraceae bacterium]
MFPEHKIQLALLNDRFEISGIENLAPENRDFFIAEASRHRIAPLLYSKVKLTGAESMLPADLVRKLREKYLAAAYRNTQLFQKLNELVARFNDNGIPVILLKGAHLGEFVYRDISLRPMSDLDILVREEHLSEAVRIAFGAGYRFFYDKKNAVEKSGESYCYDISEHYKHFQPLIHPETQCLLEIHCFLSERGSPFNIPASELWKTAKHANLNGNDVFLLSPEDLVIHLCLHAAYDHLFAFGIGALYDIVISVKHYGKIIDWQEVQRRSRQWGASRCLLLTLYFTKKWLGADIPDEMFEDFHIDRMVDMAEERIFVTSETAPLHPHYVQWRNRKGIGEKIRYILGVLLPSREFMANRYLRPKHSRNLIGSYFFRIIQAFKGIYDIAVSALNDGHYVSRLKTGDNDFRLREWLVKS